MANHKIEGTGNVTRAGFMERKRDGAKWKKAKEENDMCLSFSHPASCLFRNLFFFFFLIRYSWRILFILMRENALVTLILQKLARGRCDRDKRDGWNITMIYINVLSTHTHICMHIHLWIILQLMDKNNQS